MALIPNSIKSELNSISNNVSAIKSSLVDMGITFSSTDNLNDFSTKLNAKNTELLNTINSLTQTNNTLIIEKENLISQNANLTSQNNSLTTQNNNLTQANTQLTNTNAQLTSDNETLTSQNSELTSQNTSLTNQNASLSNSNATLRSQNETLTNDNNTLTIQNQSLTSQNNNLTTANSTLTSQNQTLTNSNNTLNGYLSAIKTVLVNKGIVTNSDAYSTYADKIGELEMGSCYRKVLINNGTNGWYLIDDATNWVKLCYIYITRASDFTNTYIKPYPYLPYDSENYCFFITLPFTFSYIKPQTILNNVSGTYNSLNGTISVTNLQYANYANDSGMYPLQMSYRLSNANASRNKLSDVKSIKGYIDSTQMNKIFVNGQYFSDNTNSAGYTFSGNYVYMYCEGMIEG